MSGFGRDPIPGMQDREQTVAAAAVPAPPIEPPPAPTPAHEIQHEPVSEEVAAAFPAPGAEPDFSVSPSEFYNPSAENTLTAMPEYEPIPPPVPTTAWSPIGSLQVVNGPKAGLKIAIPYSREPLIVGRNDPPRVKVDIDLTDAELGRPPMISRRHALLERDVNSGEVMITDLESTNGTFVGGVRLLPRRPIPLSPGSKVRFANLEMIAFVEEKPVKK